MPIFNVEVLAPYLDNNSVQRQNFGGYFTNSTEAQRVLTILQQQTQGQGYTITTNNVGTLPETIVYIAQAYDFHPSAPTFRRYFFIGAFETLAAAQAAAAQYEIDNPGRTSEISRFSVLQDGEWDAV